MVRLPSLAAARDKIRELRRAGAKDAMTVLVRRGTYFMDEPVVLTPEDSGVTYAAYPGERAVLSGGKRITGWTKNNREWSAPVSFNFGQLFVAGKRAMRARTPNQGFFRVDGRVIQEKPMVIKYRGDSIKKEWAEDGEVELIMLASWQEAHGRIKKVDEAAHTVEVQVATPKPAGTGQRDCYFWIENAPGTLDWHDEWYLDRKAGKVRFLARGPEDLNQEETIAPVLEHLVLIQGDPENGKIVRNVVFRGLDFRHTAWKLPENGYMGMQAVSNIGAAFEAEGAENVVIDHCMFTQMGTYAISFGRGCFRNRVVGNEIVDMGAGGVKIGEATMNRQRSNPAEQSGANVVADNHMHQLGRFYPGAVGVLVGQSSDNLVTHNHIHDLFFSAISCGWTWQYKLVVLKNNIIEYNHLHDLGQGVMSDMGGIYMLGEQPGTALRNNLIHDVNALVYGGWGIYLDQATSNIIVENNVVYKCNFAGFNQHFGRENLVRNNIFAFNPQFQLTRDLSEQHTSFTMERNIVYYDAGLLLGNNWSGGLKMDHNIYWDARGGGVRPASKAWKDWQANGLDVESVVADPLFVNPANLDFRLKPASPALKLGFKPIDISTVGPRMVTGPAGLAATGKPAGAIAKR